MIEQEAIVINGITDVFELFEKKLAEGVEALPQSDRLGIERLATIDGYNLIHSKGIFGIIYSGTQYEKKETNGRVVLLKQNELISVVSIIKFLDNGATVIDKAKRFGMMPAEYPQKAVDIMTGIEISSTRAVNERRIIPIRTELVDEEKSIWKYITTFQVPLDFTEINYRGT